MISFCGIASAGFRAYITKNGAISILFFIIPWVFTIIFSGSTIGFSCWLITIFFSNNSKSVFLNQQHLIKKQQSEVSHDLHDISDSSTLMTMENNELLPEVESEPIPLSSIDQQKITSPIPPTNKRPMRKKNDDEPGYFQSLENIRLQVQPNALPAILPSSVNQESPVVIGVTEMPVLKSQTVTKQPTPVQDNISTSQSVVPSSANPPHVINQSIHKLPEPKPIATDETANLKIFSSDSTPSVQQEQPNEQFVKNVYPLKAPVQGVPPPPPLPSSVNQESPVVIGVTEMPVLKAQVSQTINPQLPTKPTLPLKVWTKEQINTAWERGLVTPTYEAEAYRSDYAGALMFKDSFIANPNTEENNNVRSYSWTIVYQCPLAAVGTEEARNLWPLNCMNALAKGQDYPKWKTTITFNGRENVLKDKKWKDKRKLRKIKT